MSTTPLELCLRERGGDAEEQIEIFHHSLNLVALCPQTAFPNFTELILTYKLPVSTTGKLLSCIL